MPCPVVLHTYKSLCQLKLAYATANMWKQKDNFWVPDDHRAPICLALNHLPPGSFYVKKEKKKSTSLLLLFSCYVMSNSLLPNGL